MAQDYTNIKTFPKVKAFTASAVAGNATKITIPATCKRIRIGTQGGALWWSDSGTDGVALATDKTFIPASNKEEIPMGVGKNRIDDLYIAGQAGGEIVTLTFLEV